MCLFSASQLYYHNFIDKNVSAMRITSNQNETYKVDFLPHHLICALLLSNEVTPI